MYLTCTSCLVWPAFSHFSFSYVDDVMCIYCVCIRMVHTIRFKLLAGDWIISIWLEAH